MGLRGVNNELRDLSELMGIGAPKTQHAVAPGDSNVFGREMGAHGPSAERPMHLYKKPVLEQPKDEEPKGDAPETGGMPKDLRDAAFRELAADSGFAKGGAPEGDAPAKEPPKAAAPAAPAAPAPAKPADEKPATTAPAEKPAEKPAAKAPTEKPAAEKPAAEKPPEEKPDKDKETDAAPAKWRIPMDTVFGRTPRSDLERYLKTIAATLQAQEGMDIEMATKHIETVVDAMTKAKLLPPIKPDSPGEEVDVWMDAAMARGLASVILDRA